ncbi:MAG: serine hydrolase domain-containing protein [Candidatus Acidiferrum sp.]
MQTYTRRTVVTNLLRAAASTALCAPALATFAQSFGGANQRPGGMMQYTEPFQRQYRVPAMSVALSKSGRFVFDHAGGMADRQHMTQAQESSLFRIADLSKVLTAVTIFSLIEAGKLNLTDRIFGSAGILSTKYGKPPYKTYVTDITVDNLLTHTAGGWPADDNDPMFHNNGWDQSKLISSTIDNIPLTSQPGTQWAYSNFGYCVLGRVIEQVSGQPYPTYVQGNILAPCGITTMQIAHNSERQRASDEVVYIGQYSEDPYKINVTRMDSSGGWIASSTELVQFLNHVAGAPGIPALLKPETIRIMTTPVPAYPEGDARYARGWMVADNGAGSWWHSGSLPGSTALMIRNPDGSCAAAVCNTRSEPHQEMDTAMYEMLLNMERQRNL